jgi:hypothetical protein
MPFYDRICAEGHETIDVYAKVGESIACGTCGAETSPLYRTANAVQAVTWPGGRTFENLADKPMTFYSPAEKYRFMKQHGIQEFVRHATAAGTDKSPHTTRWAAMSPETLTGAAEMLARVGKAPDAPHPGWVQSMTVTITDVVEPVRGSLS